VNERRGLEHDQPAGLDSGVAGLIRGDNEPEREDPDIIAARRRENAANARVGSRTAPYKRKRDKVETVKTAFVCSKKVSDKLSIYALGLAPGWTRASFIEAAIVRAIEADVGRPPRKKVG
jgi:hypothetical protein